VFTVHQINLQKSQDLAYISLPVSLSAVLAFSIFNSWQKLNRTRVIQPFILIMRVSTGLPHFLIRPWILMYSAVHTLVNGGITHRKQRISEQVDTAQLYTDT